MNQKVATMNISLPAMLRQRLQEKLDRLGYGSASEYVRELIRGDLMREEIEKVDALLLEGIHSGPATPMTERDWKELRRVASRPPTKRRHAQAHARPSPKRAARSR
jgi:antitoxin ParD1/3/4